MNRVRQRQLRRDATSNTAPRPVMIEVTEAIFQRLTDLTATGFFGRTIEETAVELLRKELRDTAPVGLLLEDEEFE